MGDGRPSTLEQNCFIVTVHHARRRRRATTTTTTRSVVEGDGESQCNTTWKITCSYSRSVAFVQAEKYGGVYLTRGGDMDVILASLVCMRPPVIIHPLIHPAVR